MKYRALAALFVFAAMLPAMAAPMRPDAPRDWDVTLGVGGSLRPTFEGSDRSSFHPIPVLSVRWRDIITLGEGGLNAAWHHGRLRIGGGLTFDPGRKDHSSGGIFESGDDRLRGLGTVNAALGFRGFADYRLGPANFQVSATKFTGSQNDGVLVDFGVSAPLPLSRKLILMPHLRASWADGRYTQTYFGVTPVQSAASIFPVFAAGSGFKDVRGGATLIWRLNTHWFVTTDVSAIQLVGAAKRSPISISDTNVTLLSAIGYHF
jgi:outer membrane scaffolding protein for murein synthesis (MipA/OmpV family)